MATAIPRNLRSGRTLRGLTNEKNDKLLLSHGYLGQVNRNSRLALLSQIIQFIQYMDGDDTPIETLTPGAIEELTIPRTLRFFR